jgi:hypothetical protein
MTDKEIAAYKRRLYYAANKERVIAITEAWISRNPNYRKDYYKRNKQRILAAAKARYLRNKAILDAYKSTHA